ncbi:MAG: ATP-binding protein, partial [Bacillota bacterium]|nr:ATP-binding protein [Bacillota bacterium]
LLVLHRRAGGEVFTSEEKEAFSALAAQMGLALENIRLHDEVLKKERQVQRAERLSALGRLTAGLAHEIRNGLYKIGGCAEILQDEASTDPRVAELASGIAEETRDLAEVLDRFLSFAQEGNKAWRTFSVRTVVQDVLFSLRQELERRGIECRCLMPEDELVMLGDAPRIREAILNLVLNAIEAMEGGGELELRLKRQDGGCAVEIKDTGPGIPPQYLEEIFDPFFTTKPEGTGLGLPIADQIVREHGGRICVVSELGRGSTFTVVLPLLESKATETEGGEQACGH